MQAIILAAGMGKRLGEYTKENTKCMVPVNGVPLIDRTLRQLGELNLNRIVVVTGYEGQKLKDYIESHHKGTKIEYVNNPIYDKTNNIFSLALAKDKLAEDDSLLIESDLIFEDGIFETLAKHPFPNLALVAKYESWMDGTMVKIDGENNIVNFITKDAFNYKESGQYYKTANTYKFSREFAASKYVPFLEAYCKAVGNNEYYENVLRVITFLDSHDLKALSITGKKWYEIDDKQDLDIAEALFAEEKDVIRKYYGRYGGFWRFPGMLDYCYLVNPYFGESKIIDEMEANFRTLAGQYPSGMKVNTLLASKCWGIREDWILPGNGAAELIKALMEQLPGTLGIIRPTFEEYPNRRRPESLVTFVPKNSDYRYTADDLIDFFSKNHADSVLLINPDNPSGNFIPFNNLLRLADWAESAGTRLVVDESFVDFSAGYRDNTLLRNDILEKFPHLVVMKSISKSYGVPGIRLGILCSSDEELIRNIKKSVSIWNINSFAEFFMQIYNKYEKDYLRACDKFIATRDELEKELRQVKFLRVMPSEANYFLCEILPPFTANGLVLAMLKKYNILMRDCSDKKGLDGKQYMRIAVRSKEDNARLIKALQTLAKDC
ncbi:aminotransferase class I/II-fold pyridoxal phosphate-dependent enzyme [Fibrobacter sp. UWP2]|uniref:aminotransferase class I/II-fold pyridoxal phosphate-dependent enzyme n=1 Tax=Fibrobacter sp. UWP2 TaxID=1896216 RepID=UPI000913902E|nr:aminotransferase class I/II-fold pyridoxal phosphate-dependent enzyme [Fibrobacter sp. UWP2]SHJ29873.1 Histidinol-phosphate/aromatic aminotransferase or cobyric acid decarboxylase [Fibrobacter sp. UWP2]